MGRFLVQMSAWLILYASSCVHQETAWIETTQEDFADGQLDDGGNLYASWKGDIQVVNSWDLNDDGYLDIVFSNYGSDSTYNIHSDIYWGSKDGFHLQNRTELLTSACIAYGLADLNNDGFLDIIFGSWLNKDREREIDAQNKVWFFDASSLIYWGSDDGFKEDRVTEIPTYGATGISVADLNNDGYLDIIVASAYYRDESQKWDGGAVTIYWGNKEGYRQEKTSRLALFGGMLAFPADLNRDGFLDLIATNLDVESRSVIYYGSPDGFSDENTESLETSLVRSVAVADLNADSFLDIVFANGADVAGYKTNSAIYWGSDGAYSERRRTLLPTMFCMQPAVADLNGDGYLDIVFANCYDGERYDIDSYIYYGSEEGYTVDHRETIPTCGAHSVAVADYDANGELDLVFSNRYDPEGKTVDYFSMLYYQREGTLVLSDIQFPTHDGHHNMNRDLGNIYDREYRDAYTSSVFDAKVDVRWERVEWDADIQEGCSLQVFIRTADRDQEFGSWVEARHGHVLDEPLVSRYCQYRVVFHYDGKGRPRLNEIRVYYTETSGTKG